MAEYLTPLFSVGRLLALLASLLALQPALAENLTDPTRPPATLGQSQTGTTTASGPVLQSILISAIRRIAIISGKTVKIGDKFGEAQVMAINDNNVVLRTGQITQVLKLYPTLRNEISVSHSKTKFDASEQPR